MAGAPIPSTGGIYECIQDREATEWKMIYTIGHTESYLRYFAEQSTPQKKGLCDGYFGGSVWQTYDEAKRHALLDIGFSVFGIMADWETETSPTKDGDWHDLLVDADLVILEGET